MTSVVVAIRNAARVLPSLLESLAGQDMANAWEVIAVDNGSDDQSAAVLESFASRVPLRRLQAVARANPSYARNAGARAASGSRLLFVDADDAVAPEYVSAMARALDEHPLVTSRVDSASLNAEWVRDAHGPPWQADGVGVFFGFLPAAGINIGVHRDLFERLGGFPEAFSGSEDVAFSWRAQLAGVPLRFVGDAVYRYRYRDRCRRCSAKPATGGGTAHCSMPRSAGTACQAGHGGSRVRSGRMCRAGC